MKWSWWTIGVALVMAVLWGGQLSVDAMPVIDGYLGALLGGPELPISTHLLIVLPIVGVLGYAIAGRRVVPTVNPRVLLCLAIFLGMILASVLVSNYKYASMVSAFEWLGYAVTLAAIVATAGRENGPRILLSAIAVGGALVALKGIQEYAGMRSIDPTWRIFGGWVNQNALAGMLNLSLFACVGVYTVSDRVVRIGAGLAVALIGFALFLTQSRGGIISCGVGIAAWITIGFAWRHQRMALIGLAPLLLTMVMIVGLSFSAPKAGAASAMDRFTSAGATQEQSAGYRQLLWKSAIGLTKLHPAGTGIGTFRYIGSEPGLTPPTQLAHSTYLQLAAETSWVGLAAFVAMIGIGLREMLRGALKLPKEHNVLRAACLASMAAGVVHNQIDSLLYHFGIGIVFFAILGIGFQLSADGSGPEFMPKGVRLAATAVGCGALLIGLGWAARGEILKATSLSEATTGSSDSARATMQGAADWLPTDGEPSYYLGTMLGSRDERDRILHLEHSASVAPTLRTLRALARAYAGAGRPSEATRTLANALRIDPNNFPALTQMMQHHISLEDWSGATDVAERLLGIESTPYYKVRAIPELVVTDTASARLFLASRSEDARTRIEYRRNAVAIFLRYKATTLPRVKQVAVTGDSFAGESLAEAMAKMKVAAEAAQQLAKDYRAVRDESNAIESERTAREFEVADD